ILQLWSHGLIEYLRKKYFHADPVLPPDTSQVLTLGNCKDFVLDGVSWINGGIRRLRPRENSGGALLTAEKAYEHNSPPTSTRRPETGQML
ncbi:hypothetical protein MRX96_051453, partial [Rhipicephalus microplus]